METALTACAVIAAPGRYIRRRVVVRSLGLPRISLCTAAAIKRHSLLERNFLPKLDRSEHITVRILLKKAECLVTDSYAISASEDMTIVVLDLLKRTAIDQRLIAFQAGALLTLVRDNGHASKFDPLDGSPWLAFSFDNLHAMKTGVFKGL